MSFSKKQNKNEFKKDFWTTYLQSPRHNNVQKMTVLQFSRVNFPQDKTFYKVEAIKHRDNVCIAILSCSPYTMLTINLSTLVIFTKTVSGCLHYDMSNCSIFFYFR